MSSLKFGTSGLRGLVTDLVGEPARRWTSAFLAYLDGAGLAGERLLYVGRDLRSSSPAIAADCINAALAGGWKVVDCGAVPTPALALASLTAKASAVMVTGSHIPDDRNGLKFYTTDGEITKADEAGILAALPASGPDAPTSGAAPAVTSDAVLAGYVGRYLNFLPGDTLSGARIGIYQQSSVARDVLTRVLQGLGAQTIPFARADRFIPVDTEAHRPEDMELLRAWAADNTVDAIVSTDGDADRPLVADANGEVVRGDLLGLLVASYLGLGTIVTPITSSSAIENSGIAKKIIRTKVGSPFVIDAMQRASAAGADDVIGFEANGGVLLGSDVFKQGRRLASLATRDAVLPIICAVASARAANVSLRKAVSRLGAGHALADRLKEIGPELSQPLLRRLGKDSAYANAFFGEQGKIASVNDLDGVRFELDDGSVVHFRASGNAPEFRCYVEAPDEARAGDLLAWGLKKAEAAMRAS